jgi:hypothetical protein
MDKEYFICIKPGLSGYHKIHSKDCPFLPDSGKRIFLGNFRSSQDAELAGRQYFKKTYRCPFCSREPGTASNKVSDNIPEPSEEPATFKDIIPAWESVLMCGVN